MYCYGYGGDINEIMRTSNTYMGGVATPVDSLFLETRQWLRSITSFCRFQTCRSTR